MLKTLHADIIFKQAVITELASVTNEWTTAIELASPQPPLVRAIAGNLARFYTGVEDLIEGILRVFDSFESQGEDWHASLLHAAIIATDNRPPIISRTTYDQIDDLRKFRHVFHKMYVKPISWAAMQDKVVAIRSTLENFTRDLTGARRKAPGLIHGDIRRMCYAVDNGVTLL